MKIEYEFIEKEKLLIQKYSGEFSLEHYIAYVNTVLKTKEWNFVKKIFSDFRNIDFIKAFKELNKLTEIRDTAIKKKFVNIFIVDKPNTTAFANLYQENQAKEFNYNYCSTVDFAIKILNLQINKIEMEHILENLKFEF